MMFGYQRSPAERRPLAIPCQVDPQEQRFDALVRLWVRDEIPYSFLMKNYPDYDSSMVKRILNFLAATVN